jgi:hypothetical protein
VIQNYKADQNPQKIVSPVEEEEEGEEEEERK